MIQVPESPADIKASVDLAAIIEAIAPEVGLQLEQTGSYSGLCPWHDDTRPSLAVYTTRADGVQRFQCFPCSLNGDVFDFVQRYESLNFSDAKRRIVELRDSGGVPAPPESAPRNRAEPEYLAGILARAGAGGVLIELLHERSIDVPRSWVQEQWRVKDDGAFVYIPHYASTGGNPVGIKKRWHRDWTPIAVPGSDLSNLYGCWRDQGHPDVVLCEGESDSWLVSYLLRNRVYDVLGLPHGVSPPNGLWVSELQGRSVTLLFDADRAGRTALDSWVTNCPPTVNLRVAILPDGSDCNSAGHEVVLDAIADAREWKPLSGLPIGVQGGRYIHINAGNPPVPGSPLSDFVLEPRRLVQMSDNVIFEVMVPGHGESQFIGGEELASQFKMRNWCARRLLSWQGNDKDLGSLMQYLKAQSVTVPQVKGTDVVGLQTDCFVLPDKAIGSSGWGYVPPENDVHLGSFLHIEEEPWDLEILTHLTKLHEPVVITPILGWMAAAPLRALFRQFPILSVVGGSGWGKTTMLRTILESFGFWIKSPPTLTGSTPHAILSYASSTNAFPIWFDEVRPGARPEARTTLEQVIRDAWDGSSTIKGGLEAQRMRINSMPARAPLLVSGEDTFSETSHLERMVMIDMPKEGRNVKALLSVRGSTRGGLGHAYLSWLIDLIRRGELPSIPDLPDRPAHAQRTAEWGYSLLNDFAEDVCGYALPEYDGTAVRDLHRKLSRHPVILEALELTRELEDNTKTTITHIDSDGTGYVKPYAVVEWVKNHSDIKLPGAAKACISWLEKELGAEAYRHPQMGRCLKIPNLRQTLERLDD